MCIGRGRDDNAVHTCGQQLVRRVRDLDIEPLGNGASGCGDCVRHDERGHRGQLDSVSAWKAPIRPSPIKPILISVSKGQVK